MATILQAPILVDFLYPFLLIFFLLFAILEKTNIFGEGKKQINALISLVIALIFVSAVFPKIIVGNLMLFLSVGLVVVFVALMLWGFVSGKGEFTGGMNKFWAWIIGIAIVFAILWASGLGGSLVEIFDWLFGSSWSGVLWTNILMVALIAGAIAVVLVKKASGK
jgi:hypothetical protein